MTSRADESVCPLCIRLKPWAGGEAWASPPAHFFRNTFGSLSERGSLPSPGRTCGIHSAGRVLEGLGHEVVAATLPGNYLGLPGVVVPAMWFDPTAPLSSTIVESA